PRARSSPERRVPLRDEPLSGSRVHVQARADARGHLREPAPRARRHALHRRIVGATERLYADRLGEHVERLAPHATRGEGWDKAATYLRQASPKALSRSLNRQAVASLEEALAALEHLPESRERQEQAIDIRIDLRAPLFRLGDLLGIARHVGAALSLAESLE